MTMKDQIGLNILDRIIEKGGLAGQCARLYRNNTELSDAFIKECALQCHLAGARKLWGEKLTHEILNYAIHH
jgi:hypothetical protein